MTEELNLYQRIRNIMSELDYIQKGSKTVNGQYRFVSHDQVTAAVHPLLVKHGVLILSTVDDMTQENNRTTVKMLFQFVNIDAPQDNYTVRYSGYGIDNSDKGPGKAISYAYKYCLLKTFCLETGDDPDNDANSSYEPEKCLQFDRDIVPQFKQESLELLERFLSYSSNLMHKHVEDIKREAVIRPDDFIAGFNRWKQKELV